MTGGWHMAARSLRDEEAWQIGRQAEMIVAEVFRRLGYYVNPTYDYAGVNGDHAPRLLGTDGQIIIPDLDVSNGRDRWWVEVKSKKGPDLHRVSGVWEHGIGLRLWQQYHDAERVSATPVCLAVYERTTGDVLYQWISVLLLSERIYPGEKMDRGGMVYFPRSAFRKLGNVRCERQQMVVSELISDLVEPPR